MRSLASAGIWFAVGYLVGSIPIGLIAGRISGIDIRRYGTGNIGASNVFHNVGLLPAAVVGVGSFLEGLLPALAAHVVTNSPLVVGAAALGSVVGYAWSALLSFRGGSAVATATGALAAISPPGLVALLGMYAVGAVARQPAPGVLLGLIAYVAYIGVWPHPVESVWAACLITVVVVLKRFTGVLTDLRCESARPADILVDRLIFDRRPNQRLVGPR